MTDTFDEESRTPKADSEPKTPTLAETENPTSVPITKLNFSFSIWPPSTRTRDAVVSRLIETLSAPSVLSKRYGTIPEAEASAAARRIEEEAFEKTAASANADGDGIETLQAYSKEISKRMLEIVKSRSGSTNNTSGGEESEASSCVAAKTEDEN